MLSCVEKERGFCLIGIRVKNAELKLGLCELRCKPDNLFGAVRIRCVEWQCVQGGKDRQIYKCLCSTAIS